MSSDCFSHGRLLLGGVVPWRFGAGTIMKILVACEFSGIVRDAFIKKGHRACSLDSLPTENPGPHIQGDLLEYIVPGRVLVPFDMIIAFPPCTHLAVSGARWFAQKKEQQAEAIDFFMAIVNCDIPKKAIENPIGIMSTVYRKPDQIVQPWQFGHGETKATCLWLENLPKLKPTNIVEGREARIHRMPPSKDRGKLRSITLVGIAEAMAEQWG